MLKLSAIEVASLKNAVEYYDCAGESGMFQTITSLPTGTSVVILSAEEVTALVQHITELNSSIYEGTFAPTTPAIVTALRSI